MATITRLESPVDVRIRNPAAQILAWTDEVAHTAGCTLHGQPIPTASQLMLAAPFAE